MIRKTAFMAAAAVLAASAALAEVLPPLTGFTFVGTMTVTDKASPIAGLHHFYVNANGKFAFTRGVAYSAGTVFLGRLYELTETEFGLVAGPLKATTEMKKDAAATDTGGWAFALYAPDGKKANIDVKTACFVCHTKAKDHDFVFSRPLE